MIILLFFIFSCLQIVYSGTFTVDYTNHVFLKDGQPFRYISGSIHYFRVHPDYWNDRLQRIRALGLNAVQVYVPWNLHEPTPGTFDFTGFLNISRFLELAQQNDLYVLLRPGPYICAEWEFGGLPWWLLKYDNIHLRSSDQNYTNAVQGYYNVLMDVIKPYLYKNGGPILMVQVENEYGVLGVCDHNYTGFLRDLIWSKLGNDTQLYTTDQQHDKALSCGHVDGALATIDGGPTTDSGLDDAFAAQDRHSGGGPHVWSEYWVDWFCKWGGKEKGLNGNEVEENINHMYYNNSASLNVYMIHGGTNFGFMSGPDIITSYDYGAPVKENGATNDYYKRIYNIIKNISGWPNPPLPYPQNPPASNYGPVTLKPVGTSLITTLAYVLETCHQGQDPLTFEQIDHGFGYVLYSTTLKSGGATLMAPNLRDYGYVYINTVYQGMLYRDKGTNLTLSQTAKAGDTLRVLVENRGRDNYWSAKYPGLDYKGLHSNVTLDGAALHNWVACGINLTEAAVNSLSSISFKEPQKMRSYDVQAGSQPGVFVGQFTVDTITDTWFNSTGWGKGQLFINGFNLGRYWPSKGPQISLYVPKPVLKQQNTVLIIELIGAQQTTASFVNHTIGHYNDPQ
jgi:beta-galactosidase